MSLILRNVKGSPLTYTEMDDNLEYLEDLSLDIQGAEIVPITYTDLESLKTSNSLTPGTRYFISDRDIWIDALDTDELSMSAKRHFRIIKDEHYIPHIDSANNYLGIYGQGIAKGSVPNSDGSTIYYAIWGGRMWMRDTSGSDVPGTSNETISGGWTMVNTADDINYESKIFDIKYNFDDDVIWEQSDDLGNIIRRENDTTSYIDITDWGDTSIYNNQCSGVYNNFNNGNIYNNSNKGDISNNSNDSDIYTNSNEGHIRNNSNGWEITNNSNKGDISNNSNSWAIGYNSNGWEITNNSNGGEIWTNSNSGGIYDNSVDGEIDYNSNNGDINNNSDYCWGIYNNSNNGIIRNNSNYGRINNNSNNGHIIQNSSSTSINFHIRNNDNNGYISYNNSTANISIQYNSNNGYIGKSSSPALDRSTSISDTQVNK